MRKKTIYYYISSHGFGHATRSAEIIRYLNKIAPDLNICVRTQAPQSIFVSAGCQFTYFPFSCDVGVVQSDGLNLDIKGTVTAYSNLRTHLDSAEISELRSAARDNVVGFVSDIPSFPFRLARGMQIPSVAISNFSWDWIYESWIEENPELISIVNNLQEEYSWCDLLLQLPFSGVLSGFKSIKHIPLIGRQSVMPPYVVRERLGLDPLKTNVLLSFGGMGLKTGTFERLKKLTRYRFISIGDYPVPGVRLTQEDLDNLGISYPDLVNAVDIVATKPGYGIVSECTVNETRMMYTDRGPFREYDVLVGDMDKFLPVIYIPRSDFMTGNWQPYLELLRNMAWNKKPIDNSGAFVAASSILELIAG